MDSKSEKNLGDAERVPVLEKAENGGSGGASRKEHHPLAWYLGRRHKLIRRHEERLVMHADHSAAWELRVDLELPTDRSTGWKAAEEETFFMFPLAYLRKSEARMGFSVSDENGATIPVPTRRECDAFAVEGLARAAADLLAGLEPEVSLPGEQLEASLARVVEERPYPASMALLKLRRQVGLAPLERGEADDEDSEERQQARERIGKKWREGGLDEALEMFVEHSLIWVLLRGRPGSRRSIFLREEKILQRRPFIRWAFGELRLSEKRFRRRLQFRRRRLLERAEEKIARDEAAEEPADPQGALAFRGGHYGRRRHTFSLSTLGERIGQPLGWMPFEFEFASIYMMRCASYHLELVCPPGRAPRDLRLAAGPALAEPARRLEIEQTPLPPGARKTLTGRIARLDIPAGGPSFTEELKKDAWFRITVGIGDGAFPVLWFLVGAITATMLWLLADADPHFGGVQLQIAAAILLIVPALVGALALGSNEVPIGQLVGGARILVLTSALSAVAATAILAGARPLEMGRESALASCAILATVVTVPLVTSWLLSSPLIWHLLKKLDSRERQRWALRAGAAVATLVTLALLVACGGPIPRGILAFILLLVPVAMGLVANDRAAMKVNYSREYISASFLAVGLICLALACIELRAAISTAGTLQHDAGIGTLIALGGALCVGPALSWFSRRRGVGPGDDEVHVSPITGREMLAGESVRELDELQKREDVARALLQSTEQAAISNPYIGRRR